MTDSIPPHPDSSAEPQPSVANVSGGIGMNPQGDANISGDVVGRDKVESAGGHIIHAGPGATINVTTGTPPPLESEDLAPAPGEPPFKGLQYFDETDAELFFGREQLTAELVARLRDESFLAIVGASGSGKSSVVRAGMIPMLERDHPHWQIHLITPTAHPLRELAASLTRDVESVTATATLIDDFMRDPRSLDLAAAKVLKQAGHRERLLLVVDQFEELFTACKDESEQRAFVDNLMHAVTADTNRSVIVLIALRADFYAYCAQFDALRQALEQHQAFIGSMTPLELRRAIEEPAHRSNWQFEPGLVDLMLDDVGDEPGTLPLLSHALLATWQRRRGRLLTLQGYTEIGRANGAIANTADAVLKRFSPDQQLIARSIFLHLTELGEGMQDTRRRASLQELFLHPKNRFAMETVLATLSDERLITIGEDKVEDVVQVAHEALIREWPMLRQWLSENRESLRLHRQLAQAVQLWQHWTREAGTLYRGAQLAQAVEWAEVHQDEMSALEREFLGTSRAAIEHETAERETARQRELELAKQNEEAARKLAEIDKREAIRLRRRNQTIKSGGIVAVVLALIIGGVIGSLLTPRTPPSASFEAFDAMSLPDVDAGMITINADWPANITVVAFPSTEVGLDLGTQGSGNSEQAAAAEAHQNIAVSLMRVTGGAQILVRPLSPATNVNDNVTLHVRVPRNATLEINASEGGNVAVYGEVDSVHIHTAIGTITAIGVIGSVNLTTDNGSINVDAFASQATQAQSLELHAANGDINVMAVGANVLATTTEGNIRFIGSLIGENIFSTTGGGRVLATLSSDLTYRFDIESHQRVVYDFTPSTLVCAIANSADTRMWTEPSPDVIGQIEASDSVVTTTYSVLSVAGRYQPVNQPERPYLFFADNHSQIKRFSPEGDVLPNGGNAAQAFWSPDCDAIKLKVEQNAQPFSALLRIKAENGEVLLRLTRKH